MAVSIKDIAKLAGVSHSTVSRALRNSPLIPANTRERIERIAKQQGYAVSAIARSLVTRKTNAIGVVVTSIADPFNGEVVDGIEEAANRAGYSVELVTSQADAQREINLVRSFASHRVDGVLVASSRVGSLYAEKLADLQLPIVLLNNQRSGAFVHSVSIDNVDGAAQAVEHLVLTGHKKIAFLGDRLGMHSDAERLEGYRNVMRKHRLRVPASFIVRGDGRPEAASEAASQLLDLPVPPTAVFCYNDMSALGVYEEATRRKLRIGSDLSVCGFDDLFFANFLAPSLTTVRQPKADLGRQAVAMLLKLLHGEKKKQVVKLKGELIVRASVGPSDTT